MSESPTKSPRALHQTLVGVGVLVLAALLAFGATSISSEAGYAGVGPNFLPWVVACALALCGVLLIVEAQRGSQPAVLEAPSGAEKGDWRAMAWMSAGLLANAALITTIGFVLSCALCFVCAVRGLRLSEGRPGGDLKETLRDAGIGLAISAPVFWLFSKVLAISLPGLTSTGWI
ncbi:tripartite tricarboxylate transporter TctB family protein [Ideonella sp.]|jgi:putative tricarboxylic transport membrane protein|uniref:tripartite tricarboxylate transporter TctB family protein n=1 Tax=Ideonella sp. TaxID=1929293 RepID=UPI0037BF2BF4